MEQIRGFIQSILDIGSTYEGAISTYLFYVNRLLAELQVELSSPSTNTDTILKLLKLRMLEDGQTLNDNKIETPVITPYASNTGNGSLLASIVDIDSNDDERIINEQIQFRCISDQFTGSSSAIFRTTGYPRYSPLSWRDRGNGVITISESIGNSILSNGDFESFATNVPGSWTTDAGAAVIKETTTEQYRGDSGLFLQSDAATATATLSQNVSIDKDRIYCMTVRLKETAAMDGASNLLIKLDTADETLAAPIVLYNDNPVGLTVDYVLYNIFFTLPDWRDEDQLTCFINLTAMNGITAAQGVYIDDIIVAPAFNFGNVAYNLVPGCTEFIIDDYIDVLTETNGDGVFQTFFGRFYNIALPSASGGGHTISDALALTCEDVSSGTT